MTPLLDQIAADVNVLDPIERVRERLDFFTLCVRSAPGLSSHERVLAIKDLELDALSHVIDIACADHDAQINVASALQSALDVETQRARNWESVCRSLARMIVDPSSSRDVLRDAAEGVLSIRSAST